MKHLILFTLLAISLSAQGQFKPFAGVELFSKNEEVFKTWNREVKYEAGDLSLIYGLKYQLKNLELKTSANTLMYIDELASYTPTHSEFKVSAKYRLKQFSVKIEHMCLHPLETFKQIPVRKFAGYTKLGVYWNVD